MDFYCEVLAGKREVASLPGSARVAAHFHTNPVAPFHAVVYPREHLSTLVDVTDLGLVAEMFGVIQGIVGQYRLADEAYRIVTNGGAYQDSKHLHFHVLSPGERSLPGNAGRRHLEGNGGG